MASKIVICTKIGALRFALFLIFVAFNLPAFGQQKRFGAADTAKIIYIENATDNSAEFRKKLSTKWQQRGYLLAVADSVNPKKIRIDKGPFFDSLTVLWNSPEGKTNFKTTASDLLAFTEKWLLDAENSGYPFSSVKYTLANQTDTGISIYAEAQSGEKYNLDTLVFKDLELSATFLKWTAGVKPGEPYNHAAIKLLESRLNGIEGFTVFGSSVLRVIDNKLSVFVPVQKPVRDQLTGLVGIATVPNGKPIFTGEATGTFYNMFRSGVASHFEWRSYRARSQEMKLNVSVPYFLSLPFITRINVAYEKFDTIYSSFTRGLYLRFPLGTRSGFVIGAAFTDRYSISYDINSVKLFRALPANPASRNSMYQMGFERSNLVPGRLNLKGWQAEISAGIGSRRFFRDPEIEAITWTNISGNSENIYDSLDRIGQFRVTRYRVSLKFNGFIKLRSWLVLRTGADVMQYRAPAIFFNELDRFGGIKNLRGFNEQSIFASEFYMGTLELRFVSKNTGYIGPFYHLAWYKDASATTIPGSGTLHGLGIQSAVQTAAGVLQMAWALGKSGTQPMALNQSRFHIGISSSF